MAVDRDRHYCNLVPRLHGRGESAFSPATWPGNEASTTGMFISSCDNHVSLNTTVTHCESSGNCTAGRVTGRASPTCQSDVSPFYSHLMDTSTICIHRLILLGLPPARTYSLHLHDIIFFQRKQWWLYWTILMLKLCNLDYSLNKSYTVKLVKDSQSLLHVVRISIHTSNSTVLCCVYHAWA